MDVKIGKNTSFRRQNCRNIVCIRKQRERLTEGGLFNEHGNDYESTRFKVITRLYADPPTSL
jgi:hypothetical protein